MIIRVQLRLFFLLGCLLLAANTFAQIKCKIEHYTTEDGLSHDAVMSMTRDQEGFMWFGTWDGINRYDGHNFITYKAQPGDSSNLKNNRIESIVEDTRGYLWLLAYDKQVYRFDKRKELFFAVNDLLKDSPLKNTPFTSIVAGHEGSIWLFTKDKGLFCLSETQLPHPRIKRYAIDAQPGYKIPSNNISFFNEDAQHNFWIGTPKGICCIKADGAGNYKFLALDAQFALKYNFTALAEDADKIWFSTAQGTLVSYQKHTHQFQASNISDHILNSVYVSHKKGLIYLSTSASEIITFDIANQQIKVAKMPNEGAFLSLFEDKAGRLWIEPEQHGIIKFDPNSKTFKHYSQKNDATFYNPAESYTVFEDNKGIVWTTMKGGGFGYYNAEKDNIDYFYDEPGSDSHLFSNIVTCKYFDPAGVLWLSTNDRGINKVIFQRNDFNSKTLVGHSANKSDNEIRGIYSDKQKRTWIASKSGKIYIYDQWGKNIGNIFVNEPKGGPGIVYCIIQDKNGSFWLGTKNNGLFKADPVDKQGSKYYLSHFLPNENDIYSLSNNSIYSLLEDSRGRIWVGTFGNGVNLVAVKNNKTLFYNVKNVFTNYPKNAFNRVRHVQEDKEGNVWIATSDGLMILNPNQGNPADYRFKIYRKEPGDKSSLGSSSAQFVLRDTRNNMWVLTSGGGLNKAIGDDPLHSLKFKVLTRANGLPSDYILGGIEDNKGYLWLATENGLSKFDPEHYLFKNYDSYDGLPKTGFSETSALKQPNGDLVFGCVNGYISFNPAAIVDHKVKENLALTNLQINNQDISPDKSNSLLKLNINNTNELVLKYNQNIVSIDYTVLDYRSNNKQIYAYRLSGFDTVWHSNKNQHRATYTNLRPGNYVFEVKSLSNDLYSNKPSKKIAITILPPPWRTWWAYLLYAIAIVALAEVARRIVLTMLKLRHRISVEQKLADLKLSFFTNVSHELRTPLTLILNPIEEISRNETLSDQGTEYINVVRKNANRMVRFINQLLDLRKVQSGKAELKVSKVDIPDFVNRIGGYFTEVAREKQIKLKVTSNTEQLYAWLDVDKIDIVVYNILANAFKFTPNGKSIVVNIHQSEDGKNFSISIIDEGVGVPPEKLNDIFELYYEGSKIEGNHLKGTGIGLAFSKELVLLHHGSICAKNNANSGLTVTITLKLGKEHLTGKNIVFVDTPDEFEGSQQQLTEINPLVTTADITVDNTDLPLILLVEDNYDLRKFLSIQLKNLYRVAEAENGEIGLKKANSLMPDLILSDVMMPKMDGIQMLDQLKNSEATSHIPVVLLTARFSIENQIEGLKYGADYYLTKPFENKLLLTLIDNLLKQRKKILDTLLAGKKTIELSPGEIVITSRDETFLKKIISIVEEGMADTEFNIDTVAESIGMGRTTFYKKFKSLTNLAPVEFVRDMRLKRAKQMLDAGEYNVSEVSYAVGFSSSGYFGKCFKEKYQQSPTDYLKSLTIEKAPLG